jgi:hypothetical protein
MVLFAAIPKARERTTTTRNAGFFRRLREAKRISAPRVSKKEKVRIRVSSSASNWSNGERTLGVVFTSKRYEHRPSPYFHHITRRMEIQIVP